MPSKIYPFILFFLVIFICFQNFSSGTTLMGFDSQHPEFNFNIAFQKSLSVWQEYMGLGAQGAMSFASDISRNIVLYAFSFLLPVNFLRYFWVFLMLGLGTLGMYYFLYLGVFGREKSYSKELSFLGALFYLFNLSTMQLFYTSFDGFLTHFGFIPVLFLLAKRVLDNFTKRNVLYFLIASFFSTSQAYTGTLFFAFLLYFGIYLVSEIIIYESKKERIKNLVKLGLIYLLANLFWLLPVMFFISSGAGFVSETSINLFSSEESFLSNKKYGNIQSILELKNFWFDSTDYNNNFGTFDPLLSPWINHLKTYPVTILGFILTFVFLLGGIYSLFHKKYRVYSFLLLLSVFFLSAGTEPFSGLFNFFRDYVPLFKEAIRFPFTKFSILTSFVYAVLFAFGCNVIFKGVEKLTARFNMAKKINLVLVVIFFAIFAYRFTPYFQGKLLNPNTKVFLPKEYSQVFNYFENKDIESRIFLAPADTFWAWPYYSFGYRGSGFMSYGLRQSVFSRSFDVWNKSNESVFWEVRNALSLSDEKKLSDILTKYQIKYFVLDGNVVIPGAVENAATNYNDRLLKLLEKGNMVKGKIKYGQITIIDTGVSSGNIKQHSNITQVNSWNGLKYFDPIYDNQGEYVLKQPAENKIDQNLIYFPYSYLFSVRGTPENLYVIDYLKNEPSKISLKPYLISEGLKKVSAENKIFEVSYSKDSELTFNPVNFGEESFKLDVPSRTEKVLVSDSTLIDLKNFTKFQTALEVSAPAYLLGGASSKEYKLDDLYLLSPEIDTCREYNEGSFSYTFKDGALVVSSTGKNNVICIYSKLKAGIFAAKDVTSIRIDSSKNKAKNLGFCLVESANIGKKCFREGVLNDKNNYTATFLPEKSSENYILYLYPSFEMTESKLTTAQVREDFVIGKIEVSRFERIGASNLISKEVFTENKLAISKNLEFPLVKVDNNFSFKNYQNICENKQVTKSNLVLNKNFVTFSNNSPYCLNYFEFIDRIASAKSGYLAVNKYTLDNDRRVSTCAADGEGCLVMDKLNLTKNGEGIKVLGVPAIAKVLRVDLETTSRQNSNYSSDSLYLSSIDLENLGSSFVYENSKPAKVINSENINKTRIAEWLYIIPANKISKDSKYISLLQDNERGWVAFCGISLCNFEGSFNGFGMTWGIDSYQGDVYVVYLPQFLLFFGIVVLIVTLAKYINL